MIQGRSQDFSKGVGGVTLFQSESTHQIVMAVLLPAVGFFAQNESLQKGGHGHPRTPPS